MPRPLPSVLRALLGGAALLVTASAAGDDGIADAGLRKARGHEAFDSRRFGDALVEYQAALALGRDPRLHYNIAQALAALERYPEALAAYQAFLLQAPPGILNEAQQSKLLVLLAEIKGKVARLEIRCDVPGARVLVREQAVGTTPLGPVAVNAGAARVEVLADGFRPFTLDLSLAGGASQVVVARLERVDFTGTLAVESSVAAAEVLVDGKPAGPAPLKMRIDRGSHVVAVRARGHVAESRTVTVEPGVQADLAFSLERAPSYGLAYFGFGVGGAGVAAGTAMGILALSTFSKAKAQCDNVAKECGPAGQGDLSSARSWATASTIGFAVGVAGVSLGVYGLVTARPGKVRKAGSTSYAVVPIAPAGAVLVGTF